MKTPFESLLEGQRKIMDFWTEAGKSVNEKMSESVEKPPMANEFLQSWFDNSKKMWEESTKIGNFDGSGSIQAKMLKDWAKLQQQFAEFWMKQTGDPWSKLNRGMNGFGANLDAQANPMNYLQDWVQKSQEWTEKALLKNMPSSQHQYLRNFNEVYEQMKGYWKPIQEMIRTNTHDRQQLNELFGENSYLPMIAKFMGFQQVADPEMLRSQMQESYQKFNEWLEENPMGMVDWTEQIKKFNDLAVKAEGSPYSYMYELNRMMSDGLDSYLSMSGQGKDVEMLKLMKEIQFAYFAFVTKFTEMQQQVYQSSYKALPESLKHFSEKYQEDKTLPEYQDFFKHFVNSLEKHVTQTFASKDYSTLQSTVAKNASNVKQLMGKLIELAAIDLPFLTNSFADDVAMENQTLRKKIRDLEQRLEKIEQAALRAPEPPKTAPAKPKTTRQRAPRKKAKTKAAPVS
ncbi:MAG: hypothetical protein HKN87_09300 [Saprospiraceae bacterium]|nr:hypothetical protein [Saprospiraceae bacterium]